MGQTLPQAMAAFAPDLPLTVALSGGADSTALLLACVRQWPGLVSAVHVNHKLQAAAADFQRHCQALCARLGVPLTVQQVDAQAKPGQSPEDAARIARYEAFRAIVPVNNEYIAMHSVANGVQGRIRLALAQHADDQVETIFLALGRGAGLAGLSAMPADWQRDGIQFYRPLLGVSAADIRSWLAGQGEGFVQDPSNADERFTRNHIRARLLPALGDVFPQYRDTFARSAAHAAQAQALLTEIAEQDLASQRAESGHGSASGDGSADPVGEGEARDALTQNLRLQGLTPPSRFSRARQANLLRHWLKTTYKAIPSTAQLDELLDQIAHCTTRGHQIHIKIGRGFVKRQGAVLTWYNP